MADGGGGLVLETVLAVSSIGDDDHVVRAGVGGVVVVGVAVGLLNRDGWCRSVISKSRAGSAAADRAGVLVDGEGVVGVAGGDGPCRWSSAGVLRDRLR